MKGKVMDAMIEAKEEEDVPLRSSRLSPFVYGLSTPNLVLMLCGGWLVVIMVLVPTYVIWYILLINLSYSLCHNQIFRKYSVCIVPDV